MKTSKDYDIPAANLPVLLKRVESLNKRADKLECPRIRVNVGPAFTRTIRERVDGQERFQVVTYHKVTVDGERPSLNGWRFVATFDHTPEGALIRTLPGEEVGEFYKRQEHADVLRECDYCMTSRDRKTTFLVRNEDDTDARVLGGSCLKDFTGHDDPHRVARWASHLAAFEEYMENVDDLDLAPKGEPAVPLEVFVAWAAREVRRVGYYVNFGRAMEEGGSTTAEVAWFAYHVHRDTEADDPRRPEPPEACDFEAAREALAWAETLNDRADGDLSEYEHNLRVALASDYVTRKTRGLAASVLPSYRRYVRTLVKRQEPQAPVSEWVGEEGEKITRVVRVLDTRRIEGPFGTSTLVTLKDQGGNVLKWFSSSKRTVLEPGEWVELTATVKRHETFRGQRETLITRARLAGPKPLSR